MLCPLPNPPHQGEGVTGPLPNPPHQGEGVNRSVCANRLTREGVTRPSPQPSPRERGEGAVCCQAEPANEIVWVLCPLASAPHQRKAVKRRARATRPPGGGERSRCAQPA